MKFWQNIFSLKNKRNYKAISNENEKTKKQLEFLKSIANIYTLKPATGELREHQLKLLEFAANFFKEIEHLNIKPFLVAGNLLGAIRHKGFVPWDDDLDFGLMRCDYEKLIKYCKKKYPVCVYKSKFSEYTNHEAYKRLHNSVNTYPGRYVLDIWPFQLQLSKGTTIEDQLYIDFWAFDFYDDKYSFEEHEKHMGEVYQNALKINNIPKMVEYINKKIKSNKNIVSESENIYFGLDNMLSYIRTNDSFIKKSTILPLKKMQFENMEFFVPQNEIEYIKYEFKNYDKFPSDVGIAHHLEPKQEYLQKIGRLA